MSPQSLITEFPAQGLRTVNRFVTGHNASGDAVFIKCDTGDHQAVMVEGVAAQNVIWSTSKVPADLNGDKDVEFAHDVKPGAVEPNGTICRMIDFAPGTESNLHRSVALVYGVVIEGEFEITLGGGELRRMLPGDMVVNRSAMHKWRNVSPDKPGRMLYVLIGVEPVIVNGQALEMDLGYLAKEYE